MTDRVINNGRLSYVDVAMRLCYKPTTSADINMPPTLFIAGDDGAMPNKCAHTMQTSG